MLMEGLLGRLHGAWLCIATGSIVDSWPAESANRVVNARTAIIKQMLVVHLIIVCKRRWQFRVCIVEPNTGRALWRVPVSGVALSQILGTRRMKVLSFNDSMQTGLYGIDKWHDIRDSSRAEAMFRVTGVWCIKSCPELYCRLSLYVCSQPMSFAPDVSSIHQGRASINYADRSPLCKQW